MKKYLLTLGLIFSLVASGSYVEPPQPVAKGGTGVTSVSAINTLLGDILANGTVPFSADQSMGSHKITNLTDPSSNQDAATKNYVDTVASGLQPLESVYAATIGSNITGTYVNGASGVGATFTVTATGAFTLDGTTPPANSRILIKDQTSGFQNGVYNLTVTGSLGVSPVLTRATDYNTASDMNAGNVIPVINGTINAPSGNPTIWIQTATITTVGTDALVFVKFNSGGSGTVTSVALTVPSFLSISGSPITTSGTLAISLSGTALPVANGGTGQTTLAAHGVLVGNGTSGISAAGASCTGGQVLTCNTSADPTFQVAASATTGNYFSGTFPSSGTWARTANTFGDPSLTGSASLTTLYSNGITVTAASGSLPGITWTPAASTSVYLVTVGFFMLNTSGNPGSARLFDGTTAFAWTGKGNQNTSDESGWVTMTGIYAPGTGSAVTIKVQLASANTTEVSISSDGEMASGTPQMQFTLVQIK